MARKNEKKETQVEVIRHNPLSVEITTDNMDKLVNDTSFQAWMNEHDKDIPVSLSSNFTSFVPQLEDISFESLLASLPKLEAKALFTTSLLKTALALYTQAKTSVEAERAKLLAIRYLYTSKPVIAVKPLIDNWSSHKATMPYKDHRRKACASIMNKLTQALKPDNPNMEVIRALKTQMLIAIASLPI